MAPFYGKRIFLPLRKYNQVTILRNIIKSLELIIRIIFLKIDFKSKMCIINDMLVFISLRVPYEFHKNKSIFSLNLLNFESIIIIYIQRVFISLTISLIVSSLCILIAFVNQYLFY